MHEYYKMATQQSQKKKGVPVGVIIGGVSVALVLGGIVFMAVRQKNSN
jgi:hypothetical protein